MLNWKHFISALLSAFLCLLLLLLMILRPVVEGAQAEGEQGIYIDIGMLGDSGESLETRHASNVKEVPKLIDAVKATEALKQKEIAAVLERPLVDVSEPIQLAQIEVKPIAPSLNPPPEIIEEPEPEIKEEPEPEIVEELEPEIVEELEPEIVEETEPEIVEELEPEIVEEFESEIVEETETKTDIDQLDDGPVSDLISESDLTGTDSISQLKMSTGSGTSSALTGGVQGKTRYANMIKAMIANKNTYPKASRKRGETGTVVIQVSISHLGSLIEVKVIKSSGKKRLDRASIKAVKRAAPFPASGSLVKGELFISRMPIEYKLH